MAFRFTILLAFIHAAECGAAHDMREQGCTASLVRALASSSVLASIMGRHALPPHTNYEYEYEYKSRSGTCKGPPGRPP